MDIHSDFDVITANAALRCIFKRCCFVLFKHKTAALKKVTLKVLLCVSYLLNSKYLKQQTQPLVLVM